MGSNVERQIIWLPLPPGEGELEIQHCKYWKSNIASKPKLRSYIKLKADYGKTEGYIQRTRVKAHRSLLARLKGGTAPAHADFLFFNF